MLFKVVTAIAIGRSRIKLEFLFLGDVERAVGCHASGFQLKTKN